MNSRSLRFVIILLVAAPLISVLYVGRVQAAPSALTCTTSNAAISAPQSGATLTGVVQIEGTASYEGQFQYYKLELAQQGSDSFTVFGGLVRQQVTNGQLAVWDSASVPDGVYSMRLRLVDTTGNYCEVVVSGLKVQNSSPPSPTAADTPTAVETEATPALAVVPTALPTIQIPISTEPANPAQTPRAQPSTTKTPGSSSLLPGGLSTDSFTAPLSGILNSFLRAFLFGVMAMAGIMLLVAVVFFVRRVL